MSAKGGCGMDQKKIGLFLRELRKERELTQDKLAERFNVTSRTVSRWETGTNMPDLSMLVELSDFYRVDIREIIDGERKSESMNDETRETLAKVAEYTEGEKRAERYKGRKITGIVLMVFGVFLAISALAIFPRDSSWGAVYSVIGAIIMSAGVCLVLCKYKYRAVYSVGCFLIMLALLIFTDYMGWRWEIRCRGLRMKRYGAPTELL